MQSDQALVKALLCHHTCRQRFSWKCSPSPSSVLSDVTRGWDLGFKKWKWISFSWGNYFEMLLITFPLCKLKPFFLNFSELDFLSLSFFLVFRYALFWNYLVMIGQCIIKWCPLISFTAWIPHISFYFLSTGSCIMISDEPSFGLFRLRLDGSGAHFLLNILDV